jgi:hypothetical protein
LTKLYAKDLLEKLVSKKELKILEVVWNEELDTNEKIERLMKEEV